MYNTYRNPILCTDEPPIIAIRAEAPATEKYDGRNNEHNNDVIDDIDDDDDDAIDLKSNCIKYIVI